MIMIVDAMECPICALLARVAILVAFLPTKLTTSALTTSALSLSVQVKESIETVTFDTIDANMGVPASRLTLFLDRRWLLTPVEVYVLNDAAVFWENGLIIFMQSRNATPGCFVDFSGWHFGCQCDQQGTQTIPRNATKVMEPALLVPDVASLYEYFHFVTETLVTIAIVLEAANKPIIIVPSNIPTFATEFLDLLEVRFDICDASKRVMQVRELIVTQNPRLNRCHPPCPRDVMSVHDLKNMRTWIWGKIHSELTCTFDCRLYISRAHSSRAIANEDMLLPLLFQHGFKAVFAEDMTIRQQLAMFSSAKIIVGAHGAGLTNILWLRPGAKVIEIAPINNIRADYMQLAAASRLNYSLYIVTEKACVECSFHINVGTFARFLDQRLY